MDQLDYNPQRTVLLTRHGSLSYPCFSVKDVFIYNKERARPAFRKKEWEFYQLFNERFAFQIRYGHISYAGRVEAVLIDFETGERFSSGVTRLFPGDSLDLDYSGGEVYNLKYDTDELFLSIRADGGARKIEVLSDRFDVELYCHNDGDAMVLAKPYFKKKQFSYSYKKIFPDLAGFVHMHNREFTLDEETFLILDSTRGVFPYRHQWVWANGAKEIAGHIFALNLGWGPGCDSGPTENTIFFDGVAHKLGRVKANFSRENHMRPWYISDDDGRLHLEFTPLYDNKLDENYLIVHTNCHQLFGKLTGLAVLDDGSRVHIDSMNFFVEHAVNRW